jgi:hypothetical protein
MPTNLPTTKSNDSLERVRLYFNQYGEVPETYNANDVSATIAFFEKRGYKEDAAISVAMTILRQAKIENESVFTILESVEKFSDIQINTLVATILNNNRKPNSVVGFNNVPTRSLITRNIIF